jgi:dolichol kinase
LGERDSLELKRQVFHLLMGSAIAAAVYTLKPVIGLLILAPLVAALIIMYWASISKPDIRIADHLLAHFERPRDRRNFPFRGAIMFGLGVIPPIVLLDARWASAVILVFSFGDCFATLVGRRYGRMRLGGKSLEGSAAFMVSALPAAWALVGLQYGIILAFFGALIELIEGKLNDNVTVPAALSLLVLILRP